MDRELQPDSLDQVFIKNLLVRGIVGINADERKNRQDILVNVVMWADTRAAGASDAIDDAVNYRTAAKAMIAHIESTGPYLVERLVADLARICCETDPRIRAVEVTVEKPGAVRFSESVGVTIRRTRAEALGHAHMAAAATAA
ncbi:MAG: dihydroneopterin aldolase [Caldilineaceae bacterium]|nr:dihydroneopterin aldolase [Caldilineaceae bacterium]